MSHLLKLSAVLLVFSLLVGCAMHGYNPVVTLEEYPFRHNEFDYHYAWKTRATDKGLVVEGFLKNVRYPYISELMVTVKVLDATGKTVASASDLPMPQQSQQGDLCNFSLLLKEVKPVAGMQLEFAIRYNADEGKNGGVNWNSSFKVNALTGVLVAPASEKRGNF